MKRISTPRLFFMIVVASFSLQGCAPSTQIPTGTIVPSPTESRLFEDSRKIKGIFEENPLSVCSIERDGWKCDQDITQTGKWFLRYYSENNGDKEVYESEYIDFGGLNRDAVVEVLSGTIAIVKDETTGSSILDWVVDEGIIRASKGSAEVISHEVSEVYVFLSMTDNSLSFSLCHGDWCTSSETIQPTATSTPTESGTSIGNLSFDLPPGWCLIDETHISSFCPNFTRQPLAIIEFSPVEGSPASPRDAIVDFVKGFEQAGFQVLDFEYLPNMPPVDEEPVIMAKVAMIHPDFQQPPNPELVASFTHDGQYYLLWGSLVNAAEEGDFQYLYDSLLGLLEGMSFVQ